MRTSHVIGGLVVLAALAPAPALAAKAPQGSYAGPLTSSADASAAVTVDKGKVTALTFTWECNGRRVQTTVVSNAGGVGGATLKVKKHRFSVKRTAIVTQGTIGEPGFKEGKGAAQASGRFNGKSWSGSFKGAGFGCSASGTFTATRT